MPTLVRPTRPYGKKHSAFDGTKTDFIKRVLIHPGGSEGSIHRVALEVRRPTNRRVINLIEKIFHPNDHPNVRGVSYSVRKNNPLLRKPREQFNLIERIRRINLRKKLGLRFPRTIRLAKNDDGTLSIYTSPLDVLNPYDLSPAEGDSYYADIDHQTTALGRIGVRILKDAFFCVRDPNTKQVVAVIGDFGTISREKGRKK
jgi:hypothetical protein